MNRTITQLIDAVVEHSRLAGEAAEELRAEIVAHCEDHMHDAMLSGKKEADAIAEVREHFGSPESVGQQMRSVHRPLDWIPFIGPLLYYRPLRHGLAFMLMHAAGFAAAAEVMKWAGIAAVDNGVASQKFSLFLAFALVAFFGEALAAGVLMDRATTREERLETWALSYVPFVLAIILFALVLYLQSGATNLLLTPLSVVVIAHAMAAVAGMGLSKAIRRIRKKFTEHTI